MTELFWYDRVFTVVSSRNETTRIAERLDVVTNNSFERGYAYKKKRGLADKKNGQIISAYYMADEYI